MKTYSEDYFERIKAGARRSAEVVVPLLLRLVQPRSVIDVGCGCGTWLSVLREHGVKDVLGIDGEYVDEEQLEIPAERFRAWDLAKPLTLNERYDLAMSLEVAEHLAEECAVTFVDSLTRLAPLILFSAAIPHQGGRNHVNEQWPDYWAEHFRRRGYCVVDCLRKQIWNDDRVDWWYAQNLLLFVADHYLDSHPALQRERELTCEAQLSLVHPRKYSEWIQWSLREIENLSPW